MFQPYHRIFVYDQKYANIRCSVVGVEVIQPSTTALCQPFISSSSPYNPYSPIPQPFSGRGLIVAQVARGCMGAKTYAPNGTTPPGYSLLAVSEPSYEIPSFKLLRRGQVRPARQPRLLLESAEKIVDEEHRRPDRNGLLLVDCFASMVSTAASPRYSRPPGLRF